MSIYLIIGSIFCFLIPICVFRGSHRSTGEEYTDQSSSEKNKEMDNVNQVKP